MVYVCTLIIEFLQIVTFFRKKKLLSLSSSKFNETESILALCFSVTWYRAVIRLMCVCGYSIIYSVVTIANNHTNVFDAYHQVEKLYHGNQMGPPTTHVHRIYNVLVFQNPCKPRLPLNRVLSKIKWFRLKNYQFDVEFREC